MRRLFWLAMGVTVGAILMRKLSRFTTRAAEAVTPAGVAKTLSDSANRAIAAAKDFVADVRDNTRERAAELSESTGLDSGAIPADNTQTQPQSQSRTGPSDRAAGNRRTHEDCRHPAAVPRLLRRAGARRTPIGVADPRRPDAAVRRRRHGAVQAVPARPGDAAVQARHDDPEDPAHRGHRRGRRHHPAQHVLRDGRQLLLRRLLQGTGDQLRLGADHQQPGRRRLRLRPGPDLGDRLPRRRRGRRAVEAGRRSARRADPAPRHEGQLLVDGRSRPGRPQLRDLLRPRPGVRSRRRTGRRRGPLHRDLEPRLHGGRARPRRGQGELPDPRAAAGQEHRHRARRGAGRLPAAGRRQRLRVRPALSHHRADRVADRTQVRRRPRRRHPVPGHRRPRPQLGDADRRRRHPGQQQPRLRAAPAAAPGHPQRAAARV